VKAATVVLGTTSELVDRARRRGARDARLAAVAVPRPHTAPARPDRPGAKVRAELGATGRPLLITVASLDPHRGHELLLDAARAWRTAEPVPLVVVAG
ncbi:glycosyltransferase family 4 protein, partial [Streptomyces sp. SID9944]|nr:glycosyltransferase family 4 protein [Streptomyces sp. SID9944]